MAFKTYLVPALVVAMLGVQPCAAASDFRNDSNVGRMSAFAGLNVTVPLAGPSRAKPIARLQLTSAYMVRDTQSGSTRTLKPRGFEIGATKTGEPSFYMNGQRSTEIEKQLGVKGTAGTVLLVVGGVVLAVVIAAALFVPPQPDFDD